MRRGFSASASLSFCLLLSANALSAQNPQVEVKQAEKHDVSRPLTDYPAAPQEPGPPHEHRPLRLIPRNPAGAPQRDTAVQSTATALVATTAGLNLIGVGTGFAGPQGAYSDTTAPPDTNGSAGVTQYVQWVNTSFAVFDKSTGNPIYGPVTGNTLWSGFGGPCETNNDGDINVKYDRAAGRWLFSQLAVSGGPPYYQCLAVSTGIDATGSYNRYAFSFTNLNDYPKVAIWPDAYYLSVNQFQGNTFLGAEACAMDRNQMLAGGPATMHCFPLNASFGSILPSDLDGITPPPAGAPDFFVGIGSNSLNLWKLHADFVNPANSTLIGPTNIAVAAYSEACNGGGTCIPQSGTTQQLDSLADRLMYRLAYRNFGDHEALVVNHSITSGKSVAVRWYELRNPTTAPVLYQQGTYAPDSKFRWMGSIAMDKVGDIAVGYSVSSSSMHPAIRYTGRAPTDALGTMQAENSIIEGTGSQVPSFGSPLSRWGDYSGMAIDPGDDCTFWYTNEYLQSNGSFNWSTRIASFAFPACTAAPLEPDFYETASPSFRLTGTGTSTTFSVNLSPTGGFSNTVSFSANGLPAGATASFNPATLTASGSTTMTVTIAPGTPLGTYPVMITASSGSLSHSALVTVQIYVPASAIFVKTDTATQGTWKGVYGADGETIANDSASYPAYAHVVFNGGASYTWASPTTDVRALQQAAAGGRIASTWYASPGFSIDVNLTDGNLHEVGLYCLDWDNQGRAEKVDVIDVVSGNVLDSRSVSAFNNGAWLLWNLAGHVTMRVTLTAGANAVVSGIFFGPPAAPDFSMSATPAKQIVLRGGSTTYTVTANSIAGFTGTVNLSASGLPSGTAASFNPASVSAGASSTMTVTTTAATPGGGFTLTVTGTSGSVSRSTTVALVVNVPVPAAAVFVGTDALTQGTWKGVYGADGEAIANDSANYPTYASVKFTGATSYTWASSTADVRALQKAATSDRIASTWYTSSNFTIDVNLMDGNPHEVGIYCLDWDNQGRADRIDILDAASGNVLDTRNASAFNNGTWLLWNLSGHVTIKVTVSGGPNAAMSGIFFNAPAPADFSLAATPAKQVVAAGGSTTYTVTVNPLVGFTGTVSLSSSGVPSGATASFNPATITGSGSSTMTVSTTATTPGGGYTVTATGTSGSLSHSAAPTLVVSTPAPAAALFVKTDTATEGTWKGVYGADGEAIVNDSTNYPAYAQVALNGPGSYTWATSTTDVRALQQAAAGGRIASTWYAAPSFTIDMNLLYGGAHQVALYCLDWDNTGRAERIDILDASSGSVLDSRSISAFNNGTWLVWNLTGHVTIKVTLTGGAAGTTAVVSGLFFDATPPGFSVSASPASQAILQGNPATYTVNVSASGGFTGTVNLSATGVPAGATASFNPASVNGSGSSSLTVTTTASTPGGNYNVTMIGTSGSISHSSTVALTVNVPAPAAALFANMDTTTQGAWKGVYGGDGEAIVNDSANYPAYAQVNVGGANSYTWSSSTADVRALQKAAATDRIASTWYSTTSFSIDVNLTDGNSHEVGLYLLDWDNTSRAERIDILDAGSGNVLDTRNASAFSNGVWFLWNLTGHVTIRVTLTGGASGTTAVASGIFFNAPATPGFSISATSAKQTVSQGGSAPYTVTVNPLLGFTGTVNLTATGLPSGATASFSQTSVTGSASVIMTVTAGAATPGGAYSIVVTGASGSLSHSATVTLVVSVPVAAAASFVKTDTTTQGTWKGAYGAVGEGIANDSAIYPAYAQVTFGGTPFTWAASTTDVRALQKAAGSDRIASAWYSASSFTIDLNLMDGNPHSVGIYFLDWDNTGRAETINILDASTGTVLDSRSISAFNNGEWLVWTLSGHVTIQITLTGGTNGVVSGLFLNN